MTGAPLTPSAETPLDWRNAPFFSPVIPAGVTPMASTREHPYIWATWLARLLAGEAQCEWAGWFRANYQDWAKPPSDFDSAKWMMDHTALVNEARESREALGYQVFTEDQNFFALRGKAATLSGKPDLIAVKGNDLVIADAKTGKPSPHHAVQVLTYMYAVPRALERYRGMEFRGHVVYPDGNVQIPASGLDRQFIDRLGSLIRRLADENPARKVPSTSECQWCDITAADCPQRIEVDREVSGSTEDF